MSKAICPVEGCTRHVYVAGYCYPHYKRWDRDGRSVAPYPDSKIDVVKKVLTAKPRTVTELARTLGVAEVTARHMMRQAGATLLLELKLKHNNAKCKYWTCLKSDRAATLALIQKTLDHWTGLTADEIARHIKSSHSAIRYNMNYLHNAGLAHIVRWRLENTTLERCWAFGPGEDAPRPRAMTPTERSRKFNALCKIDPEARMRRKEYKEREAKRKAFRVPTPDPLLAAFFPISE